MGAGTLDRPAVAGRFEIIDVLGRGAQSVVYRARDSRLQREVALKTVRAGATEARDLLHEAEAVGRLHHPHVVPLFDAGLDGGQPYLVYQYVRGETLAQRLKREGALAPAEASRIVCQVLDALAHAHAQGVLHRDIKPSNILVSHEGHARVTDFGVALSATGESHGPTLVGTPAYMAPEYVGSRSYTPRADLFAVGLVLAEALTGKRVYQGDDVYQVLYRITHEPVRLPRPLDERWAAAILKALAADPAERYADAAAMRAALGALAEAAPAEAAPADGGEAALQFLLRRMRHKKDFPALSSAISEVNRALATDKERTARLAGALLRDFALTNKILRLVNSACYGGLGGNVSTVSRAVTILGFDAVRSIVVSILLFDHLQDRAQAAQLQAEFLRTLFAGVIARDTARRMRLRDPEEAFVCALFRDLGRVLCLFYFPEEVHEATRLMRHERLSEDAAATRVLGVSYEALGIGTARAWGFPDRMLYSMRSLPAGAVRRPDGLPDALRVTSGFANDLAQAALLPDPAARREAVRAVGGRFRGVLPVDEGTITALLEQAARDTAYYAATVAPRVDVGTIARRVAALSGGAEAAWAGPELAEVALGSAEAAPAGDPQALLAAGTQEITAALVEGQPLNEVLRIALETLHRALGVQRTLLAVRDVRSGEVAGRFGFGADAARAIKAFAFPLRGGGDVFHAAAVKNVDVLIRDVDDPQIAARIPDWYRQSMAAGSFLLLPLSVGEKLFGVIYADAARAGGIRISEAELKLIRTLRNQVLLAVRQAGGG